MKAICYGRTDFPNKSNMPVPKVFINRMLHRDDADDADDDDIHDEDDTTTAATTTRRKSKTTMTTTATRTATAARIAFGLWYYGWHADCEY